MGLGKCNIKFVLMVSFCKQWSRQLADFLKRHFYEQEGRDSEVAQQSRTLEFYFKKPASHIACYLNMLVVDTK